MRWSTLLVSVLVAALAGCGDEGEASQREDGPGFRLGYARSGGLVGLSEELRVRPGRYATVSDGYGEDRGTTRFRLTTRRVEDLRDAFRAAGWSRLESPGYTPACADCFAYEIEYGERTVRFDSASYPDRLGPVVRRLDAIVENHRPLH